MTGILTHCRGDALFGYFVAFPLEPFAPAFWFRCLPPFAEVVFLPVVLPFARAIVVIPL
jgi:hypothetical protein